MILLLIRGFNAIGITIESQTRAGLMMAALI